MKKFFEVVILLILGIASVFVTALCYQVFWNEIVLNVWQMFAGGDIVCMEIRYGVFLAVAIGLDMVCKPKKEEKMDNITDAISLVTSNIIARLIICCLTMAVTTLVF